MALAGTIRATLLAVALVATASACTSAGPGEASAAASAPTTAAPTTTAPAARTPPTTTTTAPPTTTTAAPRPRLVTEQAWTPFAVVGGVTLHHPSARVERVAFHEANHDGARQLEPLPTAVRATTLESRERGTGSRTAADVVIDPDVEVRSPVTGVVKRGGTYVLYCDNVDHFVVIEPDGQPGWEVKVLHMRDLHVARGQRVVAAETILATGPTPLPFESQVDEVRTADPAWPHVHVEVVDPSIPDRPGPGSGC